MDLSDAKKSEYTKRLLLSRMRILCDHGFYGLLLMHIKFALDESVQTACTDGVYITFSPKFLEELSDRELDFVMMHEIMHVVLQHCMRGKDKEAERYNIACDIVVNSNILLENKMNPGSITLKKYGVSMHQTPNGKEGHEFTAEQVYEMLPAMANGDGNGDGDGSGDGSDGVKGKSGKNGKGLGNGADNGNSEGNWDNHTRWGKKKDNAKLSAIWKKHLKDAAEAISIRDASENCGNIPLFAQRILEEMKQPQVDWRTVLQHFIQEEITDYSLCPPDRRFGESPFFLPDFNEKEDVVRDILFMIDTSGSMSDEMITAAYSEIKGAIEQFNGKLKGWLGFFDAEVVEPQPFEEMSEFEIIKPVGGGGTDFGIIFDYVNSKMQDQPPASIIILTDGYAPFPKKNPSGGIPVLWLLNNDKVQPPWGRIVRIKV